MSRRSPDRDRKPAAIVLVAGMGQRLGALKGDGPKCLVEVAGRAILSHIVEACDSIGCDNIVLVTGFEESKIRDFMDQRRASVRATVHFVRNMDHATTGTAASLALGFACPEIVGSPLFIIEGDTVFGPELMRRLLSSSRGPAEMAASVFDPLIHSGTRLFVNDDGVVEDIVHAECAPPDNGARRIMKTANVMLFRSQATLTMLNRGLSAVMAEHGRRAPLEFALRWALKEAGATLSAVEFCAHNWFEVDTPEDLALANRLYRATPVDASVIPAS